MCASTPSPAKVRTFFAPIYVFLSSNTCEEKKKVGQLWSSTSSFLITKKNHVMLLIAEDWLSDFFSPYFFFKSALSTLAQWSTFFQMQDYHDWTQKFRNLNMLIYKYLFSIPLPYQTCLHLALLFMCLSYKIMKVFLTISITFVFRFILVECWKSFSQQKKLLFSQIP